MRFVVVYQREPHAGQMAFDEVAQPRSRDERAALAKKTLEELRLDVDLWIDDLGDQSRAMFGDLPHSAIVIDPSGTIRLKLSWCEPEVLRRTLPELERMLPKERARPADAGFLDAIAEPVKNDEAARHHRRTMLAHLAMTRPDHAHRSRWLLELADDGPPEQRDWARRQLDSAPRPNDAANQPPAKSLPSDAKKPSKGC